MNEPTPPASGEPSDLGKTSKTTNDDVFTLAPEVPVTITDCTQAFVGLPLFLDGALAGRQMKSMQTHLEQCPPCLDAFQFQTGLRSMVQRGCHTEPPSGMRDRVFGRIFGDELEGGLGSDSGPGF